MKYNEGAKESGEIPDGFKLTLFSDVSLTARLTNEVQFVLGHLRQAWPAFRRHPIIFIGNRLCELKNSAVSTIHRPHVLSGSAAAMFLVFATILAVLILEKHSRQATAAPDPDEVELVEILDFHNEATPHSDRGVGAGEKGRVGFANGRGEGSRPEPAKAHGGGGGGMRDQTLPSQGRPPVPSIIPAPIPTTLVRLPAALPEAGIDIDPALWSKLSYASYGDPRSKTTVPSNGPGDGGGVGTNTGSGIGEGSGRDSALEKTATWVATTRELAGEERAAARAVIPILMKLTGCTRRRRSKRARAYSPSPNLNTPNKPDGTELPVL